MKSLLRPAAFQTRGNSYRDMYGLRVPEPGSLPAAPRRTTPLH